MADLKHPVELSLAVAAFLAAVAMVAAAIYFFAGPPRNFLQSARTSSASQSVPSVVPRAEQFPSAGNYPATQVPTLYQKKAGTNLGSSAASQVAPGVRFDFTPQSEESNPIRFVSTVAGSTPMPKIASADPVVVDLESAPTTSPPIAGTDGPKSDAPPVEAGQLVASAGGRLQTPDLAFQALSGLDNQVQFTLEKEKLKYPNLGSQLNQLVASVEAIQATAQEAARFSPIYQDESVAVTIHLAGNVDDVIRFLVDNGGDPRNVGEDYIEAYVPVTLLGQVSELTGVNRVREIVSPQPDGPAGPVGPARP